MDKIKSIKERVKAYADKQYPSGWGGYERAIIHAEVEQAYVEGAEDEMLEAEKRHTVLITWNDARNPPDHERKVLLMNRRAGVEYSTGWYDRENEQWNVDDRTMIAVDYWREIHE